jgi:hypothetical protein
MIGAFHREWLSATLGLADPLHLRLVLALGKPAETVVLEDVGPDGDIRYWRDDQNVHHVPKRTLDEIVLT